MKLDNTRLMMKLTALRRLMDHKRRDSARVTYLEWFEMYKQAIDTYVKLGQAKPPTFYERYPDAPRGWGDDSISSGHYLYGPR